MSIEALVAELDKALDSSWKEYVELHQTFDTYRGRVLTQDEITRVNELCVDIQKKFKEMYHAYKFVSVRHVSSIEACSGFESWILDLKEQGALDDKKEEASA